MARRRESGTVVDRPAGGAVSGGAMAPSSPLGQASATGSGTAASSGREGTPSLDQIAQRAYEIYQSRGGTDGQDMEDWLQAERELRRGFSGE
jgi:hypothetical protein